ncbi:hypothetical protein D3C78_1630350 [compost metagenome]
MLSEHVLEDFAIAPYQHRPPFDPLLNACAARRNRRHQHIECNQRCSREQTAAHRVFIADQPVRDRLTEQHHHQQIKRRELPYGTAARKPHQHEQREVDNACAQRQLPPGALQLEHTYLQKYPRLTKQGRECARGT